MAFDAGMLRCVLREIDGTLRGGKIEKIHMPQKDMVILHIKSGREVYRLLINAGPSSPRICITEEKTENPAVPPMFCMMLRKHLGGAKLIGVEQLGFERAARLSFETYDELGFKTTRCLIAEIMGKYSNLIFTDAEDKILGLLKTIDFSTSQKRQLLPGMRYEEPPKQDKADPTVTDERAFNRIFANADPTQPVDKKLTSAFAGIASVTAREIAYRAGGRTDVSVADCAAELWCVFNAYLDAVNGVSACPTLVTAPDGTPKEFMYMDVCQYGDTMTVTHPETFSALIDSYFAERSRQDTMHQRAADILHILANAQSRTERKLALQQKELSDCEEGERYRLWGDLITANIYRLKKGEGTAKLENYYEDGAEVEIPLEVTLTPAQNAQKYYKKYAKTKSARVHLTEQIARGREELQYLASVSDALTRAQGERDLAEIRDELYRSGYASRMKNYVAKKQTAPTLLRFRTDDGRLVYCGKNNTANDYLTTKFAARSDWWFHVKNQPGSHVVLQSAGDADEPTERDFTQAALIAAYHSAASDGVAVPVDYTHVRAVKKPSGAKPGFVIYTTNWTAYVTPDRQTVERLRLP